MSPEQSALRAKGELELTAKAFDALRKRYIDEMLEAQTPEDGWRAILALRACNSVATSLHQYVVTAETDKHFEENPNG
jgi:hypothetical protein